MDSKYPILFVYLTTNLINGRNYVGQHESKCNIDQDKYMGSGKLLNMAIKKYGKQNFKREILEICENEDHLDKREIFWVAELKTHVSQGGYNITWGGKNKGCRRFTPSLKTKLKLSIANTGQIRTEEFKEFSSICKLGDLNPAKKQESRNKISKNRKNKLIGINNSMSNTHRTRNSLKDKNIELKGDKFEYLRSKIKCINISTNEIRSFDGVKDVLINLKLSRNKYYNSLKSGKPANNIYIFKNI